MSYSAKIVLNIEDPNGNADGTGSGNDADSVTVYRRTGPESGGGSWVPVQTYNNLADGRESFTFEDVSPNIDLKTPYFYKTITTRGSDTAESTIVGPIMLNGLHELAYPGNPLNDQSGVPNYIETRPLIHFNAEWEYNFHGGAEYQYISGEYVTNQVKGIDGWDYAYTGKVLLGPQDNTPTISTSGTSAFYGFTRARNYNQGFTQRFGLDGTVNYAGVALDEGYTQVIVRPYAHGINYDNSTGTATSGTRIYENNDSTDYELFPSHQTRPGVYSYDAVYNVHGNTYNRGDHIATSDYRYHVKNASDGGLFTQPAIITHEGQNYFGAPNGGVYPDWPGYVGSYVYNQHYEQGGGQNSMPGIYGRQAYNIPSYRPQGNQPYGGYSNYNNTNSFALSTGTAGYNNTANDPSHNKLTVEVYRLDRYGAGSFYLNGTKVVSWAPTQVKMSQGRATWSTGATQDMQHYSNSWWGQNGYTNQFDAELGVDPSIDTSGFTYNVPPIIPSGSNPFATNWGTGGSGMRPSGLLFGSNSGGGTHGKYGYCEMLAIPSVMDAPNFQRLIAYLQNKFGDLLHTQGDYS